MRSHRDVDLKQDCGTAAAADLQRARTRLDLVQLNHLQLAFVLKLAPFKQPLLEGGFRNASGKDWRDVGHKRTVSFIRLCETVQKVFVLALALLPCTIVKVCKLRGVKYFLDQDGDTGHHQFWR